MYQDAPIRPPCRRDSRSTPWRTSSWGSCSWPSGSGSSADAAGSDHAAALTASAASWVLYGIQFVLSATHQAWVLAGGRDPAVFEAFFVVEHTLSYAPL